MYNKRQNKENQMKIVSIEGLDKAGKNTATNILSSYFEQHGLKVNHMSYPNYDSPIGSVIRDWLYGDFKADEKTFEFLQAADKQHAQTLIKEFEADGTDILLMDRYKYSMLAYGSYDNDSVWLQELTKYMRDPDVVVYLDVEPEVSMARKGEHGVNDYYEGDLERLRHTKASYESLFKQKNSAPVMWVDANTPKLVVNQQLFQVGNCLYDYYVNSYAFDDKLDGFTGDFSEIKDYLYGYNNPKQSFKDNRVFTSSFSVINLNDTVADIDLGFSELDAVDKGELAQYESDLEALEQDL